MRPDPAAALAGWSTDPQDVCAAVRWVAPHICASASDDVVLEALSLAERLPAEAEALWLWWVARRRPELVSPEAYEECEALPADVRAVLSWVAERGADGLRSYASAFGAAQPYARAIRELERAGRQFPALLEALDAVRAGAKDPSLVMGQLPGGWSSAALQNGRKALVTDVFFARERAVAAGAPSDLPMLRVPRFSAVAEPYRSLCLQILAGLPGSSGVPLDDVAPAVLPVSDELERGHGALMSQQLKRRGLPVAAVPLDAAFWLGVLSRAGEEWTGELEDAGTASVVVSALRDLLAGTAGAAAFSAALAGCKDVWSAGQQEAAADTAVRTLLSQGQGASAADLLDELAQTQPALVARHLEVALHDLASPEVTLLAFTHQLRASVRQLAQLQETLA